jgi:hypothetical protein
MSKAVLHWSLVALALFVFGPLAGSLTGSLRAADGGPAATLLVCTTPAKGVLVALGVMALAAVPGLIAARLVGVSSGMMAAGLTLAWASWRTGTVDEILRVAQSDRPLWTMAGEGALVGVLGILLAATIVAAGKPDHGFGDQEAGPADAAGPPASTATVPVRLAGSLKLGFSGHGVGVGLPAAIAAGAGAAWLIAIEPNKGQCVVAACLAGLAAAAVGRVVEYRTPAVTLFLAMAVLAIVGPISAAFIQRDVVGASLAGNLFHLSYLIPLDWTAGALIGIPLGASWAASMIDKRVAPAA